MPQFSPQSHCHPCHRCRHAFRVRPILIGGSHDMVPSPSALSPGAEPSSRVSCQDKPINRRGPFAHPAGLPNIKSPGRNPPMSEGSTAVRSNGTDFSCLCSPRMEGTRKKGRLGSATAPSANSDDCTRSSSSRSCCCYRRLTESLRKC